MKKLILSLALFAFAIAVQAGDNQTCTGNKSACCTEKTKMHTDAGCCTMKTKATASKSTANAPMKLALMSPKAAEQARK
jgi:hypothetical protein